MTTRRRFIAGLLTSAAAPALPASAKAWSHLYQGYPIPFEHQTVAISLASGGPVLVRWTDQADLSVWSPAP